MNIQLKYLAIGAVICMAVGALIEQRFESGSREVIKTQIAEQVKTQEVDQKKNNDVIVTKETDNKDGTKTIITTETKNDTNTDTKQITDIKKTTIVDQKASKNREWYASLEASVNLNSGISGLNDLTYTGSLSRRIIGPIYMGGSIDTKANLGAFVGLEF